MKKYIIAIEKQWGKTMIKLSDRFTYKRLLKFTMPSIFMLIFTSIYGVVDGFFVSNFVGKTPFAAVNFIMPFLMMLSTLGFMFGTGGSALVSKIMGEGDFKKANSVFSLIVYTSLTLGVMIAGMGFIYIRPIADFLGASGKMIENCVIYGRIILVALPFFILQMEFQSFFVAAEKPQLGLISTIASGVCNMIFDYIFIVPFKMGIIGAAFATGLSQVVGGLIPIVYFSFKNSSLLKLGKTHIDFNALLKVCVNGSSELMNNVSMSLVNMLYNIQLLKYAGEDGVAAYGVLMYVNLVFIGAFIGYSIGSAPVISYHFGAKNSYEVKNLLKKSIVIISWLSAGMLISSLLLASPLSKLFVGYDKELFELTKRGFLFFSFSFLFSGLAIFFSGFFTALNDGITSMIIAFLRTLVFQVLAVMLLPLIWKTDGIWASLIVAEVLASIVGVFLLCVKKDKYI